MYQHRLPPFPYRLHLPVSPCYVLQSTSVFFRHKHRREWAGDPMKDRAKLTRAEIVQNTHASVGVSKQNIHKTIELFCQAISSGVADYSMADR